MFYKEALGGELTLETAADSPIGNRMPAEAQDLVLHATLTFGSALLMASDSRQTQDVVVGTNNCIHIMTTDLVEAEGTFNKLAEGGKVLLPFARQFWGAMYGKLTDKFGVIWMVNCAPGGQQETEN